LSLSQLGTPGLACRWKQNRRSNTTNDGMGKAVWAAVLVTLESATRYITMVEAFVGRRAAWTFAQGCRCSFLATTSSVVRLRQKLSESPESGARSGSLASEAISTTNDASALAVIRMSQRMQLGSRTYKLSATILHGESIRLVNLKAIQVQC
jgi:hypothetical protein